MYSIENNYYPMIEAVLDGVKRGESSRYHAAMAWWLARQQIQNENDFWQKVAGKITVALDATDRDAIASQLKKHEEAFVEDLAEWPETPAALLSLIQTWTPDDAVVDIAAARADAILKVDRSAEHYRLNFITPGSGQTMAYQQKLEEARMVVADDSIADDAVPHIVAEAAVDGVSRSEKAAEIVAMFTGWQAVSAGIEAKRRTAKRDIEAADTVKAIKAAADVRWEAV